MGHFSRSFQLAVCLCSLACCFGGAGAPQQRQRAASSDRGSSGHASRYLDSRTYKQVSWVSLQLAAPVLLRPGCCTLCTGTLRKGCTYAETPCAICPAPVTVQSLPMGLPVCLGRLFGRTWRTSPPWTSCRNLSSRSSCCSSGGGSSSRGYNCDRGSPKLSSCRAALRAGVRAGVGAGFWPRSPRIPAHTSPPPSVVYQGR